MIFTKPRHYSKHILLCIYQAWREKQQKPNISLLGSAPQRTLISVDRQTDHQSVNSSLTHLSKHWEDATSSSPGRWCVRPRLCVCVCLECTFFCFSFLPLKHLLLWRQSLLQELHVKLILFLHLLLLPETHLIAYIALETEAQRDHGVANATEMRNKKDTYTSGDQEVSKNKEMSFIS